MSLDVPVPSLGASDMPDAVWAVIRSSARAGDDLTIAVSEPWRSLFAPLCRRSFVVGQLGQSLDGRIATPTGHSHYINGPKAIVHLHRLRALVDAVVVGVGTVVADDPMLTVRHVEGQNPARVVIDPTGRLPRDAKLLTPDGSRRCIVTKEGLQADVGKGVEIVPVPLRGDGKFDPAELLRALNGLGFQKILVEGGAATVSAFLASGLLDRLHLIVAPLIIGGGPLGLNLPPIDKLDAALRPPTAVYQIGSDMLFDCALNNTAAR
jgi:diaminohydroxyphosphoribosylaminopyrimidine deaminase/5-amino-6-(5-phosphoribosylamino)uracil reductase